MTPDPCEGCTLALGSLCPRPYCAIAMKCLPEESTTQTKAEESANGDG